jgi:site-specific DNA recombinase
VILGHKSVQRWNLPGGWVISARSAHPALVSEADLIATQDINAARRPAPHDEPVLRRYLLAGLLGRTCAMVPGPARPKNTYIREDKRQAIQYLSGRQPYPAGCCVLSGDSDLVP